MDDKEKNYFKALYNVARVINASLETSTVLEEIVQRVAAAMQVKACSLRLLDARRRRLLMGASCGLSEGYLRKGPILVEESGLDRQALFGETVWIEDAQTDEGFQYKDKAKSEGIHSLLVVPLKVGKKSIGVLRAYAGDVRKFNEEEILFLEAVADLSAIALENARLHQALQTDYDLLVADRNRIDDN